MKSRKGFTLIELLVVIAIIAILAAILFPVFLRAKAAAQASHCQSNMNQIGKAIKMYLSDWEDTYPTNRMAYPFTGWMTNSVTLSNPASTTSTGDPVRFQNGVNWVEALYPYVEKVSEGDAASAWKCPAAKSRQIPSPTPSTPSYAAVTYAFNYNLIEMPEGVVKNAGIMMVVRELDSLYNSVLRPTNQSGSDSGKLPIDPFLDSAESPSQQATNPKYRLHGDGSHILFADGHVKGFGMSYFPSVPAAQWDATDSAWYNYATSITEHDPRHKSIQITP